jgi:5-methylcytosine-specific restriction endonuclease McrA
MNRLRQNQFCPLHRSFYCCGRKSRAELKPKQARKQFLNGVTVIEDQFHPRGFRERCSQAELSRRKDKMLKAGQTTCFYCQKEFELYSEIVVAHIEPKGMGGARHDDHESNLTLSCKNCNLQNGSKRLYQSKEEERTA